MEDKNRRLREIPHLDAVLSCSTGRDLQRKYHRRVVVSEARALINSIRAGLLDGSYSGQTDERTVAELLAGRLDGLNAPAVVPVINATGILLHTNLGRAVLGEAARKAVNEVARGYSSLEFDLETGRRGKRDKLLSRQICALTGAEDATVVNNCAAAVMIALNTMASEREVITSRGELVEIGGSYRVPDVIPASGCRLVEVGTTNRTRIGDYEQAISEHSGLLLKTHASNYRVRGFTEETTVNELVELGSRYAIPVMVDLGSGYIRNQGMPELDEPELLDCVEAGADIVCISGDKLLGGPQCGIILGRSEWVARIRKNPLWRVLRLDKLCIAALSATLSEYICNHDAEPVSSLSMQLAQDESVLLQQAQDLRDRLAKRKPDWSFEVCEAVGSVGGGSLPDQDFLSHAVAITASGLSAEELEAGLRDCSVPVIGYVMQGRLLLNVASLLAGEDDTVAEMIGEIDG